LLRTLLLYSMFWRIFGGAKHSIALPPVIACGPQIDSGLQSDKPYGFRDREFFKLKILAIYKTKYELVG
jgi:hypothetical protein